MMKQIESSQTGLVYILYIIVVLMNYIILVHFLQSDVSL